MRSYILLCLSLFIFDACLLAQTTPQALAKARDYLNARMVLAVLESEKDSGTYKESYTKLNSAIEYQNVGDIFSTSSLLNAIKNAPDSLTKFSNGIGAIDVKPFGGLSNKEAANNLVAASFKILDKYYPGKITLIGDKKETWISQLVTYFNDNPQTNPGNSEQNDNGTGNFISKPAFFMSVFLLLVLLIGITYYMLLRFKRVEKKLSDVKPADKSSNTIPPEVFYDAVNKPKSQIQKKDISKFIDDNDSIIGFQKAIQELQTKVFNLEVAQQANSATVVAAASKPQNVSPQPTRQEQPAGEVFYMGGPVNNYFPANVKSSGKENTVYKFMVKANKEEALFELHTQGAPIKEIVSLSESYIKPACDEENIPLANVRNIITLKPGRAVLESDKWMIRSKALIRYE